MAFTKRHVTVPVPTSGGMHLPDPKWCRKNFRDVDAMRQFAHLSQQKYREMASPTAAAMVAKWPHGDGPSEDFDRLMAGGLLVSLSFGLAYGGLQPGPSMPREAWEALCFTAGMDTLREPKAIVSAFVFACFAGNFIARSADGNAAANSMVEALDWEEVLTVSPRVAVVQDATEAVWNATAQQAR